MRVIESAKEPNMAETMWGGMAKSFDEKGMPNRKSLSRIRTYISTPRAPPISPRQKKHRVIKRTSTMSAKLMRNTVMPSQRKENSSELSDTNNVEVYVSQYYTADAKHSVHTIFCM